MPLVVNRDKPHASGGKSDKDGASAGIAILSSAKRTKRKPVRSAASDRLRIVGLSLVILLSVCAIGWYLAHTQRSDEPRTATKSGPANSYSAALAPRSRSASSNRIGVAPGMPNPSLPGGMTTDRSRFGARSDAPVETPQEPAEGIH